MDCNAVRSLSPFRRLLAGLCRRLSALLLSRSLRCSATASFSSAFSSAFACFLLLCFLFDFFLWQLLAAHRFDGILCPLRNTTDLLVVRFALCFLLRFLLLVPFLQLPFLSLHGSLLKSWGFGWLLWWCRWAYRWVVPVLYLL